MDRPDARPEASPKVTYGVPLWIKALGLLAILVAVANAAMVWFSLHGNRDLVRRDYYQAGLDQDGRIARRSQAAAFSVSLKLDGPEWTVTAAPSSPASATGPTPALEGARCTVHLRRPDDGRLDRVVELSWSPEQGAWRGPGFPLRRGHWDILVEWQRDGVVFMEHADARFING